MNNAKPMTLEGRGVSSIAGSRQLVMQTKHLLHGGGFFDRHRHQTNLGMTHSTNRFGQWSPPGNSTLDVRQTAQNKFTNGFGKE